MTTQASSIIVAWRLLDNRMRAHGLMLVGLMLVSSILEGVGVGLVLPLFKAVSQPDALTESRFLAVTYEIVGKPGHGEFLIFLFLALFVFFIFKNLFLAFVTYVRNRFVHRNYAILSNKLLGCYMSEPYSFHLRRNSAGLVRNLTQSVGQYFMGTILPVLIIITEGFVVVAISIVLLTTEPGPAIAVAGVMALPMFLVIRGLSRPLTRWGKMAHDLDEQMIMLSNFVLGGIREIKVFGRKTIFQSVHREAALAYSENAERHAFAQEVPRFFAELLAIAALLSVAAILLAFGRGMNEILPVMGMFGAAAFRLMPSVNRIGIQVNGINFNAAAFQEILEDLIRGETRRVETALPDNGVRLARELTLTNVCYRYEGEKTPALNGVDMVVRRGEWVALVGPSGGGKSTLINVLLGLLDLDEGEIRIDGASIRGGHEAWRQGIGYVPQDAFLIDDTLRHNISFTFGGDIDETRLDEVAQITRLDEFIDALPQGYDTVIGERGVRLSGGQRQRLSIARALYSDPDILIFDEATAALDAKTESDITAALRTLQGKATIIVIAHRLSTVRHCDRIFWMIDGRIVDSGTFAELHERNSDFRSMVSHLDVSVDSPDQIDVPRANSSAPEIT